MLVHKETMGVLYRIWTGEHRKGLTGLLEPVVRSPTLSDVDDPNEWYEIPDNGPFSKTILMYYPWITLEFDSDGNIIGVSIQDNPMRPLKEKADSIAIKRESENRGYSRNRKLRPKELMPFLRRVNNQ